jgi:hypothetical protein
VRIHRQMHLCIEPPFGAGHRLISAFRSAGMGMYLMTTLINKRLSHFRPTFPLPPRSTGAIFSQARSLMSCRQ